MIKKKPLDDAFSYCRDVVARDDPDRYLASLFALRSARPAIWVLLAFNQDIARVRDNVTDPNLGYIRLQWVREQIENIYAGKDVQGGPVYRALASVIDDYDLPRDSFDVLIDVREFDLGRQGPQTTEELIDYADRTSTPLIKLLAKIILPLKGGGGDNIGKCSVTPSALASPSATQGTSPFQGEDDLLCTPSRAGPFQGEDDLRNIARAYALIGLVRASEFHRDTRGWHMIPPGENMAGIVTLAREYLKRREARVGGLPAMIRAMGVIADIHARRIEKAGFDMANPALTIPPPFLALRVWARVRGVVFF